MGSAWGVCAAAAAAGAHLDEVGLVLLVPRRDEPVHLPAQADLCVCVCVCVCELAGEERREGVGYLFVVVVGDVPF